MIILGLLTIGILWLHAQENPLESISSPIPNDKWAQIQDNNKAMLKSLDEIEKNLNFVKIRSMSGGRSS